MSMSPSLSPVPFLGHNTLYGLLAADLFIVLYISGIVIFFITWCLMVGRRVILFILEREETFNGRLFAILYFLLSIDFDVGRIVGLVNRLLLVLILVVILILCGYVWSIDVGQIETFIRC